MCFSLQEIKRKEKYFKSKFNNCKKIKKIYLVSFFPMFKNLRIIDRIPKFLLKSTNDCKSQYLIDKVDIYI